MSFDNLGCQSFGLTNPVTVVVDGAGVAMSATINTTPQQASIVGVAGRDPAVAVAAAAAAPRPRSSPGSRSGSSGWAKGGQRKGRDHHELINPSGM